MTTIHEAINNVMQSVGYVQKKQSGGVKYSFAGEAALIEALRPEMVANGLYIYPESISHSMGSYTTKYGAEMNHAIVNVVYRVTHTGGESITASTVGEGADVGDKALNKAMTGAYKYALRQLFCIETGDDPDKYPSQEQERQSQPARNGNGAGYEEGDEVLVMGKDDEKLGLFMRYDGNLLAVRIDGKEFSVKPERVKKVDPIFEGA